MEFICISPVEFTGHVNVIHEALNVKGQIGRVGAHQLLELLALLVEAHQRAGLGPDIQLVLLGKVLAEVAHQNVVKALPAQLGVERRSKDLE